MLRFSPDQLHDPVLRDRRLLLEDVLQHLVDHLPGVVAAYPRDYFIATVNQGIDLALDHEMDDVHSVRLFVRLRWEIAPGWYKEPSLAAVLSEKDRPAAERLDDLMQDRFGDAWLAAHEFNAPEEWREPEAGA